MKKEDRFGTNNCPIAFYETCVDCPYFYRCKGRYKNEETILEILRQNPKNH